MQQNIFSVALPLLASVTAATTNLPPVSMLPPLPSVEETPKTEVKPEQKPFAIIEEFDTDKTAIREVAPEKPKEKRLICKGCNTYESRTLDFLQDRGITDKNALATIMGNIRQESTFIPTACEGTRPVPYHLCKSGGTGIIQWSNAPRYHGLGNFARKYGGDPSTLDTQLRYMMHEGDWKMIEPYMKTPGKSIHDYMILAKRWIRWGIAGARTNYAYDYSRRLVLVEVDS